MYPPQKQERGIIQISIGGEAFASSPSLKDMAVGALAIAEPGHRAAERYPVQAALHKPAIA